MLMMGVRTMAQEALFYEFSVERHVPADQLLRKIDRFVDLSDLREELRPFYSETGRPSIDPELMIRMLIIRYTAPRVPWRKLRPGAYVVMSSPRNCELSRQKAQ
jgi:hypothetical protein